MNYDIIEMEAIALLIRIYIYQSMLARQSFFYSLVLMPHQIVDINYIYTILYLPEGVHIWHNNWLVCVSYNTGLRSDHRFDLEVEVQGQIYLSYGS